MHRAAACAHRCSPCSQPTRRRALAARHRLLLRAQSIKGEGMHFRFAKQLGLMIALSLFAPLVSAAQEHIMSHKEGGIQFALPAGWQSDADGDRLLVHSPDKSVAIVFFVATEDNF